MDESESSKRCNACGDTKSISEYNRLKQSADGYDYRCRSCQRARWKDYQEESLGAAERRSARKRAFDGKMERAEKICHRCSLLKPFFEFYKDDRKRDGLYGHCKACHAVSMEPHQQKQLQRRRSEPELLEKRRKTNRAAGQRYREANLDAMREKARERKRRSNITAKLRINVLLAYGNQCYLCGGAIQSADELHIDHVIPDAKGGATELRNLRPTHAACNQRKGDRCQTEVFFKE